MWSRVTLTRFDKNIKDNFDLTNHIFENEINSLNLGLKEKLKQETESEFVIGG